MRLQLGRLFRTTLPIIARSFPRWVWLLAGFIALSVILGVIPTLKSEIESGLLTQFNTALKGKNIGVWDMPVERFAQVESKDRTERIAYDLLKTTPVRWVIYFYLVLALIGHALGVLSTYFRSGFQSRLFASLRAEGLKTALSLDTHELPQTVNIASNLTSAIHYGAESVTNVYGFLITTLQLLFTFVTALYFVSTKSPQFAGLFLLVIFGQAFLGRSQGERLKKKRQKFDEKRNDLTAKTTDILDKREILLAWDQQERYGRAVDALAINYAALDQEIDVHKARYDAISRWVFDAGRIATLVLGLYIAVTSSVDIGDAYFLISLYVRLLQPANDLLHQYDWFRRSQDTSSTFLEILERERHSPSLDKAVAERHKPAVQFRSVKFGYGPREVLKDCSFTAPRGEITMLVGPSGSGKTTIARLLLGFWKPQSGDILLDNKSILPLRSTDLRLLISYIAQSDHTIDDTVRENLGWAYPEPTETDMIRALEWADIQNPKERLDEKARTWSVGEQQRLSLARLKLDTAPLAILDEPTAGFDPDLLRKTLEKVKELARDRTIIVISHQLALMSVAHRVVQLTDNGSVQELTPKQLQHELTEITDAASGS